MESLLQKYVIPKTKAGQPEVSALFAGGLWIGGRDKVGNIKLAASTYRNNGTDFWSGPLDPIDGITDLVNCNNWDRHFTVFGSNIKAHINNYDSSIKNGTSYLEKDVPDDVKAWPSKGNPFFEKMNGFKLPVNGGGLAPFFDLDGDDTYNPLNGDYPILSGLRNNNYYADQMVFWIINDNGNVHTLSKGSEALQIEIQNMAYAFLINDYVINNTTLYSSKMIYKGTTLTRDAYLGIWTDPDLGCGSDDMIGCDTTRSLMYVYNGDAVDGSSGCNCGTTPTYCNEIPMVGIDILNGGKVFQFDSIGNPIDTVDGKMTSFTYFAKSIEPQFSDPTTSQDYYNYLSGRWKDGTKYTYGGLGFNPSSTSFVNYVFTDEPCNPSGWSMASLGFPGQDFRTIQTTGPFSILPGQTNEISYAVVFAPKVNHPKPCLNALRDADDRVQIFFDELFGKYHCDICPGPDAPDLITLPKNQSITFSFFNNEYSNNQNLDHLVYCKYAPKEAIDPYYRFEGYRVFQLKENV
ncbi:MAG: hypothetical protein IPL95_11475 [Saprospiraceae bacterium]|nr:hypothetical protein [Saprospiraceae bacterium]